MIKVVKHNTIIIFIINSTHVGRDNIMFYSTTHRCSLLLCNSYRNDLISATDITFVEPATKVFAKLVTCQAADSNQSEKRNIWRNTVNKYCLNFFYSEWASKLIFFSFLLSSNVLLSIHFYFDEEKSQNKATYTYSFINQQTEHAKCANDLTTFDQSNQ